MADLAGPLQEVEAVQEEPEVKGNDEETEKKVLYTNLLLLVARGLGSTDRVQQGPYKNDRGPIFPSTARAS